MIPETAKKIPGYAMYYLALDGRVFTTRTVSGLPRELTGKGRHVTLMNGEKRKQFTRDKLIEMTFQKETLD